MVVTVMGFIIHTGMATGIDRIGVWDIIGVTPITDIMAGVIHTIIMVDIMGQFTIHIMDMEDTIILLTIEEEETPITVTDELQQEEELPLPMEEVGTQEPKQQDVPGQTLFAKTAIPLDQETQ